MTMTSDGVFEVEALVPGMVTEVLVGPGATVEAGQELLLIESMKMEVPLVAERGGRVVEVLVQVGEPVDAGQVLMRLQAG
jgi:acetyl-CoA carboxylase biotin carboxyl carrier protein